MRERETGRGRKEYIFLSEVDTNIKWKRNKIDKSEEKKIHEVNLYKSIKKENKTN